MIATKPLDLRTNLKKYMDFAFRGEPVVIARPKNENVVMLSEQEYNELAKAKQNAEYLQRIDHSYEQLAKNQTISFSLEELQEMESDSWKPTQKIKDFMEQMENE
jgi:antitoxin YefM|nr:MAG: antitoxin [Bacteriophage sp.]